MLSRTRVGRPTARTGAASMSWRVRCRESRTSRTASGLGVPGILAAQHIDGDAGIFRVGGERVDAGQVDEGEVVAADAGHEAHALLDGDAGIVGDLLAQAGQAIEKCGFAGVGRADEDDGAQRAVGAASCGRLKGRSFAAGIHRAASDSLGTSSSRCCSAACRFGGPDADGFGGLVAEGDFHAVDAVDGGVAGRGAAQSRDQGIGDKAHMHQWFWTDSGRSRATRTPLSPIFNSLARSPAGTPRCRRKGSTLKLRPV